MRKPKTYTLSAEAIRKLMQIRLNLVNEYDAGQQASMGRLVEMLILNPQAEQIIRQHFQPMVQS